MIGVRPGCVRLRGGTADESAHSEGQELSVYLQEEDCWTDVRVVARPSKPNLEHLVEPLNATQSSVEPSPKSEEQPEQLEAEGQPGQLEADDQTKAEVLPKTDGDARAEEPLKREGKAKAKEEPKAKGRPIFLSTWNHTALSIAASDYNIVQKEYVQNLLEQHATVIDALAGVTYSVNKDCVAVSIACAPDAAPSWMMQTSHWSDAVRLAEWLVNVHRMKPHLASLIAKLQSLRSHYEALFKEEIAREAAAREAAEAAARKDVPTSRKEVQPSALEKELQALLAGPPPKHAVSWLKDELYKFMSMCESLPAPWATRATQLVRTQLEHLAQLPRKFQTEIDEQQKKLAEVKHLMEEQQRNNAANLIMDHKRGKVDLELKQKDAREEADTELKRQAQELPGEKREEFMRRGREKLQNQQRLELEKWANQQERDAESAEATLNGMRVAVENSHKREHAVIINEQRRQPFKLLESELVKELDDLMIAASVLLTGDAAAGKTCIVSQVVIRMLEIQRNIVPIVIKVHHLQRQLLMNEHSDVFANAWNWVDAHLQIAYGADSKLYAFLMQAMRSRRALLIVDGIDEGGLRRAEIEAHVARVLAKQKHTLLVTSRPIGVQETKFEQDFYRLSLCPLSDAQQEQLIKLRLPTGGDVLLTDYVRIPPAPLGHRVTSNPLMLSLVISIFRMRQGSLGDSSDRPSVSSPDIGTRYSNFEENTSGISRGASGMPETVTALYEVASKVMLSRIERRETGESSSLSRVPQLSKLLQETLLQAHFAQQRALDEESILAAALRLFDPKTLASVKRRTRMPKLVAPQRPKEGDWVQITTGDFAGECGHLESNLQIRDDKGRLLMERYTVHFPNETNEAGLALNAFISSGLDREQCELWAQKHRPRQLLEACESLPPPVRDAIHEVVDGTNGVAMRLLHALEADPMRTFQEFFVVKALCAGVALRDMPPWRWTIWWENTLQMGKQIGDGFRKGLKRGSGADSGELKLRGKIAGDREVSLVALGQLLRCVEIADLSGNHLGAEGARVLATDIAESKTLKKLNLSENRLGSEGARSIARAITSSVSIIQVDMRVNELGPDDEARFRKICTERRKVRHRLDIYCDMKPTLIEYE